MRKHANRTRALIAAVVAAITISLVIPYQVLGIPQNQVPYGNIPSINYTSSLGFNNITHPSEFNESGNGFKVTFELRSGGPEIIYPSRGNNVYFGITYLAKSYSSPYTGVAFYVSHASFSIGNYDMTAFNDSYVAYGPETVMWLQFTIQKSILTYDSAGQNYAYSFCISVLPIMFLGPFHTNGNAIVMESGTAVSWYHIE